jgi:predicted Holliday junction resolvase-like endonuclease
MEVQLFVIFALAILLAILFYKYSSLKAQLPAQVHEQLQSYQREAHDEIQRQVEQRYQEWCKGEAQSIKAAAQNEATNHAQAMFLSWREREIEQVRGEQRKMAENDATMRLQEWKIEQEKLIRFDAAQRSHAVTIGKVTEHLVPYMPDFAYNPKDVRFIGSPVDLIVFDGLNEEEGEVREIVFVEVKTGKSSLSKRERKVRNAVRDCKVSWVELRVGDGSSHTIDSAALAAMEDARHDEQKSLSEGVSEQQHGVEEESSQNSPAETIKERVHRVLAEARERRDAGQEWTEWK